MRKTFTGGAAVGAATMALSMVLTAFTAHAAVVDRNVLVKGPGSSVYYLAEDGKRYVFPTFKTYATWFSDFDDVKQLSLDDLTALPLGGNVTYRPGIKMIKIDTDPKVYAVGKGGELRWISGEDIAEAIYGEDWRSKIDDVPDAFFVNYKVGRPIMVATDFSPADESDDTDSINEDKKLPKTKNPKKSDTKPMIAGYPLPPTACAWRCTEWSGACTATGATQTRTCSQGSQCQGRGGPKPAETRSCTSGTPGAPGTVPAPTVVSDADTAAGAVIGGSEAILAKFKFSAASEPLTLTKASFSVATANAVTALKLFDGTTQIGSNGTVDASGNVHFTGLTGFTVPAGGTKDLTVRGMVNSVGTAGTTTGSNAKVTLKDTAGAFSFEMRGTGTSTTVISTLGGDKSGSDKIVRKSVPTVTLSALPTSTLVEGQQTALRVAVAANAAGDVSFKTLTVQIAKADAMAVAGTGDATHSTVRVMGATENLAGHTTASSGCAAAGGTTCTLRIMFDTEQTIAAGTTKTYDVYLNVTGTATGNVMTAKLLGDDTLLTGALTAGTDVDQVKVGGTHVNAAWSDVSAATHSATVGSSSNDWASATYVKTVPTEVQTLTK